MQRENMKVRSSAVESLVEHAPLLSKCNKYLLCSCGMTVRVYSVKSGELIHELRGHQNMIISLASCPNSPYQVISADRSGCVKKWDILDCVLVKTIELKTQLFGYMIDPLDPRYAFCTAMNKSGIHTVYRRESMSENTQFQEMFEIMKPNSLQCGMKGHLLAAIAGEKSFIVQDLKSSRKFKHILTIDKSVLEIRQCSSDIECLTVHPSESCVALGHIDGKISVWTNVLSSKVVHTHVHWHSLPVRCLCFTGEGSHLLSGGHESVLVKWQHRAMEHREFLPRLGAPITSVSSCPGNTHYITTHADNSVKIIKNWLVYQVYQGLTRDYLAGSNCFPAGLNFDPRSGALVVNGLPGHLQFYSLEKQKLLYNLDIVCQNYVSDDRLYGNMSYTKIELVEFDKSGDWMVAVERWSSKQYSEQCRMKFWMFDQESQSFVLNTDVDTPHQGSVQSVKFSTLDNNQTGCLISLGKEDKKFKLWTLADNSSIYKESSCWTVDSTGYYQDMKCQSADFSDDGTVLAVSFENIVTIWDPISMDLCTVLPQNSAVKDVLFLQGSSANYLVVSTMSDVIIWDLLTYKEIKRCNIRGQALAAHSDGYLAVVSFESVHIMKPCETEISVYPLPLHTCMCTGQSAAKFIPWTQSSVRKNHKWTEGTRLFMATKNGSILTLTDNESEEDTPTTEESISRQFADATMDTPLGAMLRGQQVKQATRGQIDQRTGLHSTVIVKQIMDTPSQTMPLITNLCNTFVSSLLFDRVEDKNRHEQMELSDESSDQDDDDDVSSGEESKLKPKVQPRKLPTVKYKQKVQILNFKEFLAEKSSELID